MLGLTGGEGGVSQLTAEGGFAPEGLGMVLTGVVIVIFAFVGAEIATIAAAESDEPKEAVTKATNSVIGRVLVFYVLSVFLIVCIVPWNSTELGESPFVAALDIIGIAGAADIMNAVVLTAVLSCLNSGLYVASRMMFALAHRGDAPQWTIQLNSRGVPARAILLATSVGYVSVIAAALWPETIFLWLVNSSGAVALFVYLLIAVSELRMRARLEREDPERLEVRMWGYPWLTYLVIAAIVVVIGSMAFVDDVRSQLWWSLGSLAVVLGAYALRARFGGDHAPRERAPRFAREDEPAATGVLEIAAVPDDLERLDRLIRETLPELEAHGLNYGPFHYRYESGREGDAYRCVAERKHGSALRARADRGRQYLAESRADRFPKASARAACASSGRRPRRGRRATFSVPRPPAVSCGRSGRSGSGAAERPARRPSEPGPARRPAARRPSPEPARRSRTSR